MKKIYKGKNKEYGEDATKFGEFVCTCYSWLPPNKQKENSKRLSEITKLRTK